MFRESASARYLLRAVVAMLLAFLAALVTALTDDSISHSEWATIALATVGVLASYMGIGAAVPPVEPFIGNKLANTEVPVPPAEPEPAHRG